jgi:hypothetical protein
MAWTVYRSTDASAPVLTGEAGKLIAVLDACLVDGYGAKAAAGWTKAFADTNKAAYRQGAASDGALQAYLRVLNDGSTTGGNKEALTASYESMSSVDVGANAIFNSATGGTIRYSTTADTTARAWIVAADSRLFYFFSFTGDTAGYAWGAGFGDIYSYKSADAYRAAHFHSGTANSALLPYFGRLSGTHGATTPHGTVTLARDYLGNVGGELCQKVGNCAFSLPESGHASSYCSFNGILIRPNTPDGAFVMAPVYISDYATDLLPHIRGVMRGIWQGGHRTADVANGDTFSGVGDLSGKTFEIVAIRGVHISSTVYSGYLVLETSDTLPTN